MFRNIQGLNLLITGASRGIGRAVAEQSCRAGARVAVVARSRQPLEELATSLRAAGGEAWAVPADLTHAGQRNALVARAVDCLGGIDVLINNAGVASFGHFASSTESILRTIMEVNFFAAAELTRLCLPYLEAGRRPAIVNVGSICGRVGLPALSEHSASKHALLGWSEALRAELVRFGIDVLVVLPGLVKSDDRDGHLLRNEGRGKFNMERATEPEIVAKALLKSLRTNRNETIVGWDARWLLRAKRLWPGLVRWAMARKVRRLYPGSEVAHVDSRLA